MRNFALACMLAFAATAAAAQITADQVAANSLQARGGAAQFAAVRNFRFSGHLDLQGKPAPLTVWCASNPARIRVEVALPQGKLVQGFDGITAWELDPGRSEPRILQGDEASNVRDQALGFLDLLAAPNVRKELLGQGSLDGHDYYKLGLTLATGDGFIQYLDAHTWLAFHEEYPGGLEDISDYRKVGALLLPFRYVSGPPGQPGTPLVRDQVELNPALDPALFRLPAGQH
ncbi:MAG: hypothetical protein ACRD1E_00425 [Terriglobales bacterium]